MVIFILTACPAGLRGHLTRWLLEVNPGVFIGRANPRLRDRLWEMVLDEAGSGRMLLVYEDHESEQGFAFRTSGHDWNPVDLEGATLLQRVPERHEPELRKGWSTASRMRRRHR
ncbi:MAG: type I-E CRISPR-associated endoribonuclease Cas2e [Pseudoclavibacter sp.]|nr:type I-E CRISPR-associated endoribonuclease Cas2e [Pseudoclavibacter sp.]